MSPNLQSQLDNVYSFEVNNIMRSKNSHIYSSAWPHKSSVNLILGKAGPFIYHDLGHAFVAYDPVSGMFSAYGYTPGSRGGFADRPICLQIHGGGVVFPKLGTSRRVFTGSLWDCAAAWKKAAEFFNAEIVHIGYLTIKDRRGCYFSGAIDRRVFDGIINLAGFSRVEPTYPEA